MNNYNRIIALVFAMSLAMTVNVSARVYTWERYNIAFEAPEGGHLSPFNFFDPTSAQVDWDDMVMTLQHYTKNENTTKKNLDERLKSRAMGFNMYDNNLLTIKVKGFKCYSLEGTMPDGSRCLINYLVSDNTSTVVEVVVNYLLGNQEVVEDIIKSFSENNNLKPNEREKPKQKIQKKKDAEKQEQELKREKRHKNEKVYEC